jgi:transglutaminase-like putative cysteine protease
MKRQAILRVSRKAILFSLAFLLIAITLACNFILGSSPATPVPSAPESISIGDFQLQLISATKMDSYESPITKKKYTPADGASIFLVVRADVLTGELDKILDVAVSVVDETGSAANPAVSTTLAQLNQVEWLFPVARSSTSFKLHFPDGQEIPLDALITSAPGEAPPLAFTDVPAPPSTPAPVAGSVIQKNPRKYRVEFVATLKNDGFTPNKILIYQPRPVAWDGQQDMVIETVSPQPSREGADPVFGNGMYYWNLNTMPRIGESIPIKIQFTYTAYEIAAQVDPNTVQPYDRESPLYRLYTRPEQFIESNDSQIADIANRLADGEQNPYLLARRFYDYVIDTARYRLVGKGLLGAKALLTNGEGECGDYSALFIALARAKGIPARSVVGYWAITGTDQTHVWAEFYLEGVGWIPVDPTIGQQSSGNREYYFGNMDNQRVILEKGFNIPMAPPTDDHDIAPLMQGPYWWFWGDSGDGDKMSLEVTSWMVTTLP